MKTSKTLSLWFVGMALTLMGASSGNGQGGGGFGCGANTSTGSTETTPQGSTPPTLQIQPRIDTITVDGENFYALCTNHDCSDISWSISDASGADVTALTALPQDRAKFSRHDGESNGGKLIPDPGIDDGTLLHLKACTSDGTACDQMDVTVVKSDNSCLENSRIINDACQYDAIGAFDSRTTSLNFSSVVVTDGNQKCFNYPGGSLLLTVCGKNYDPKCDNYLFSPFKIDLSHLMLPKGTDGCPDLKGQPPQWVGADGTIYDFFDANGDPNAQVFQDLPDLTANAINIAERYASQTCGGFNTSDFQNNKFVDALTTTLNKMTFRQLLDCAQGLLMMAENTLEWVPSLFSSGLIQDQDGNAWDMQTVYACVFKNDAFGKTGQQLFGLLPLNVKTASIAWNSFEDELSAFSDRPTVIGTTSAQLIVDFDLPVAPDTVNSDTVSVCVNDLQNHSCVPINGFNFSNNNMELTFNVDNLQVSPEYELRIVADNNSQSGVEGENKEALDQDVLRYFKVDTSSRAP